MAPREWALHTWFVAEAQRILVTGATGKVGQAFIGRLLASGDERFAGFTVRALCHHRTLRAASRLEVVTGSIDQRDTAEAWGYQRAADDPRVIWYPG